MLCVYSDGEPKLNNNGNKGRNQWPDVDNELTFFIFGRQKGLVSSTNLSYRPGILALEVDFPRHLLVVLELTFPKLLVLYNSREAQITTRDWQQ